MSKHPSQTLGYSRCPSLPLGPKTWPSCCLPGARSPDQGPWSQDPEIWRRLAKGENVQRSCNKSGKWCSSLVLKLGKDSQPSQGHSVVQVCKDGALFVARWGRTQHGLDSATAPLAQGLLWRLRQDKNSSGFRDACEIVSQSLDRHRYYHLKMGQSRSTPALHGHFWGLTALSGKRPSPASQASSAFVIFREQRQASALSSFCLTFSYGINMLMLITKKVVVPQFWKEILFCCWFQRASWLTYA